MKQKTRKVRKRPRSPKSPTWAERVAGTEPIPRAGTRSLTPVEKLLP